MKDKDGKRIPIEDKQLQRWAEYFREVLNRPDPAERAWIAQPLGDKLDIDCSPSTINQILRAIKSLKNNKSPGIGNITAEILISVLLQTGHKTYSIKSGMPRPYQRTGAQD